MRQKKYNIISARDRFITNFNYADTQKTVLNSSSGIVNSNDIVSVTEIPKSAQEKMNDAGLGWYNLGGIL